MIIAFDLRLMSDLKTLRIFFCIYQSFYPLSVIFKVRYEVDAFWIEQPRCDQLRQIQVSCVESDSGDPRFKHVCKVFPQQVSEL